MLTIMVQMQSLFQRILQIKKTVQKVTHKELKSKYQQDQQLKGEKARQDKSLIARLLAEQKRDILQERRERTLDAKKKREQSQKRIEEFKEKQREANRLERLKSAEANRQIIDFSTKLEILEHVHLPYDLKSNTLTSTQKLDGIRQMITKTKMKRDNQTLSES